MDEKLHLSGMDILKDEGCYRAFVSATLSDEDFEGHVVDISVEFSLASDITDIAAVEAKAIMKAENLLKELLLP
jgi:hypothetical protein